MNCSVDLRFFFPPLISLLFMLLIPQVRRPWEVDYDLLLLHSHHIHPFWGMTILLLIFILVLLFLSISTTLPLTVKLAANTIRLKVGDFSASVTVSLLCAVFLPPPLFWTAYPAVICVSPCFDSILKVFKCTLLGFCRILQSIPPPIIVFSAQQEHPADQETPQIEVELVDIVVDP